MLRPLKVNNVIQNAATIRSLLLVAGINATRSQYHSGPGPIPDSAAKKIMADQDIGMWNFYGALYGPPPLMDVLWSDHPRRVRIDSRRALLHARGSQGTRTTC